MPFGRSPFELLNAFKLGVNLDPTISGEWDSRMIHIVDQTFGGAHSEVQHIPNAVLMDEKLSSKRRCGASRVCRS